MQQRPPGIYSLNVSRNESGTANRIDKDYPGGLQFILLKNKRAQPLIYLKVNECVCECPTNLDSKFCN